MSGCDANCDSWRVGDPAIDGCAFTIYSGPQINGGGVYEAHVPGDPTPANKARANLFSAANELLTFAEAYRLNLQAKGIRESDLTPDEAELLNMADAAIAKAKAT